MYELKINYKFKIKSTFHSTADKLLIQVDKSLNLKKEQLFISGSHLKGILRNSLEIALIANDIKVCFPFDPNNYSFDCIVCKYFGSPRNKGPLIFHNIKTNCYPEIVYGTSIHRKTKVVREKHLFSTQIAFINEELEGKIRGYFPDRKQAEIGAKLIYLSLMFLNFIGGDKSRGRGWIEIKDTEYLIQNEPLKLDQHSIESLIKELKK